MYPCCILNQLKLKLKLYKLKFNRESTTNNEIYVSDSRADTHVHTNRNTLILHTAVDPRLGSLWQALHVSRSVRSASCTLNVREDSLCSLCALIIIVIELNRSSAVLHRLGGGGVRGG